MDRKEITKTYEVDGIYLTGTNYGLLMQFKVGSVMHSFKIKRSIVKDITNVLRLLFPDIPDKKN